jgi:tRNA threonylcarbamoyladenosine biosynthesis protein TsaB
MRIRKGKEMKILGVDTCSHKCSVALTDGDNTLYSIVVDMPRGHSENLFTMIETALKEAKLDIDDVDAFSCSVGPGAFTGIRVGISSIKALSLATDKPAIGIRSADAIVAGLSKQDKHILVALESKRKDVYWQLFDNNLQPINEMSLSLASDVAEQIKDENLLVIGDGAIHFKGLLPKSKITFDIDCPLPENICKLAKDMLESNTYEGTCEPLYLRDADVSKPKNLIIPRIEK